MGLEEEGITCKLYTHKKPQLKMINKLINGKKFFTGTWSIGIFKMDS